MRCVWMLHRVVGRPYDRLFGLSCCILAFCLLSFTSMSAFLSQLFSLQWKIDFREKQVKCSLWMSPFLTNICVIWQIFFSLPMHLVLRDLTLRSLSTEMRGQGEFFFTKKLMNIVCLLRNKKHFLWIVPFNCWLESGISRGRRGLCSMDWSLTQAGADL